MKCVKCGNELGENDKFCPICGTQAKKENEDVRNQNTYTYDRPVNQQVNYGQQYGKNKNTNDVGKTCVIIIIVVIIFASLFVMGRAIMKAADKVINDEDSSNGYSNTTSNTSTNGTVTSTSSVSASKSNSYKVSYAGFKLYIPDTLIYEMDYSDDVINIGDAESTWIAQFGIKKGSFQKFKQNRNSLKSYLMQEFSGVTASNPTVETIDGVEYVLLECNISGTNMIIGYAELNSMYTALFEIMNENNDFDRSTIKNLSAIISNAEYAGDSTYMKTNEDIKITGIDKAFDKTLEETEKDGE